MSILKLPKIVKRPKKRLGRGHGSGKVKTSGRGTKGQKARGTIPRGFEGGQLPLIRRLPYLRGKGRNRSARAKAFAVNVTYLAELPSRSTVNRETLQKYGLVETYVKRVKIIGNGTLPHALTVALPCSGGAKAAIEKAGGTVLPIHE